MGKREWTFLTNHGRVFAYIARHPRSTTREIADKAKLSVRAIQEIIRDLEIAGYIERRREGRRNHYTVHPELPMRHQMERNLRVGDILLSTEAQFSDSSH